MSGLNIRVATTLKTFDDWSALGRKYVRDANLCISGGTSSLMLESLDGAMHPHAETPRHTTFLLRSRPGHDAPVVMQWLADCAFDPSRVWDRAKQLLPDDGVRGAPYVDGHITEHVILRRIDRRNVKRDTFFNPFGLTQQRPLGKLPRKLVRRDLVRALASGQFEEAAVERLMPGEMHLDLPATDALHRWGPHALQALDETVRGLGHRTWKIAYDPSTGAARANNFDVVTVTATLSC